MHVHAEVVVSKTVPSVVYVVTAFSIDDNIALT